MMLLLSDSLPLHHIQNLNQNPCLDGNAILYYSEDLI